MRYHKQLISYVQEAPRAYAMVVAGSVVVGCIEFLGISSLYPAVSVLLGDTASIPGFMRPVVANLPPVWIFTAYLALIACQALLTAFTQTRFIKYMAEWRTETTMRYLRAVLDAEFDSFTRLKPGEMEVVITRNVGFAVKIRHRTVTFIADNILACFYVLLALFVSLETFILFGMIGFIYWLFTRLLLNYRVSMSRKAQDNYLETARLTAEHLADPRTLLSSPAANFLVKCREYLHRASRAQYGNDCINILQETLTQPLMLLLLAFGVFLSTMVLQKPNSETLIMLFVFYRAAPKLIQAARGYGEIIQDSPVDMFPEVLRWEGMRRQAPALALPDGSRAEVRLENVSVSFAGVPVLRNFSLTVPEGSFTALVGPSGSGKSTVLDLVCGYRRPEDGRVIIGGHDLSEQDVSSWRERHLAVLRDESSIVTGSFAENIAFLADAPDSARVEELVRLVGLEHLLDPQLGSQTRIEVRGTNLSAGQRQRILLARALYKRPRLLVLDEPTSNLDAATERDINAVLLRLRGEMTIIMATHRTAVLDHVDAVVDFASARSGSIQSQDAGPMA